MIRSILFLMFLSRIYTAPAQELHGGNGRMPASEAEPLLAEYRQKAARYLNSLTDSTQHDTTVYAPEGDLGEVVLFTEEGMVMKDFQFHTVETARARLDAALKTVNASRSGIRPWLFIGIESHIDQPQLLEMLWFFKLRSLAYRFGSDKDFERYFRGK